jgi:hypothetical protein
MTESFPFITGSQASGTTRTNTIHSSCGIHRRGTHETRISKH